jgi:ATP-dependent RNA helicase RhlE
MKITNLQAKFFVFMPLKKALTCKFVTTTNKLIMDYRIEKDTIGEVKVPANKLWGAQTERSRNNFKIGPAGSMPLEIVYGFAYLKKAAAYTDIRSICLYGGVGKKEQTELLQQGCDIIVSTPGRFIDLYSYGSIPTRQIKTLVLDEADRMMELGFMPQLRQVLEIIPVKRQNLLFSATFPERVEGLAAEFLEFPTRVESDDVQKPVKEVSQFWYAVPNFKTKLNLLMALLATGGFERTMVFCRTKDSAERASRYLSRQDIGEVRVLHGNKGQNTRINALKDFREGAVRMLVTTDVTSRGIDVENVSHVINFELPKVPEDYLHRIGRTARIHRLGEAISFVNKAERYYLKDIERYIDSRIDEKPVSDTVRQDEFLPGEKREIALQIDHQKRKADPTFKGAFHDRQKKSGKKKAKGRSGKGRR